MKTIALAAVSLAACNVSASHEHDEECGDNQDSYATVRQAVAVPGGSFGLVHLDVGQGDATIVIAPSGCAALIDGGGTSAGNSVIKANLAALGVTSLDFAVTTHFHADHLGGIDEVDTGTDAVPIGTMYDRGGTYTSAAFTDYANQFATRRRTLVLGETLSLCNEVSFHTVAVNANGVSTTNENGKSVAVAIRYGAFDAMVGGDLTGASPDIETSIAASVGDLEVYKVNHHGSSTSSNAAFLAVVNPTVSVISLGWNNSYGHPAPDTVARLNAVGTSIWQTEDPALGAALGHIEIVSANGSAYSVTQGGVRSTYMSKGVVDTEPPTVPSQLVATGGTEVIELAWQASTDAVGIDGYRIYRSDDGVTFALLTTTTSTTYADQGLPTSTTRWYQVTAIDMAGNESAAAGPVSATTDTAADTTAPTVPVEVTASATSPTTITVNWAASTDAGGVTGYTVRRDGIVIATTTSLSHVDTVGPSQSHGYTITASDAAGNESAQSQVAQATTPCSAAITALTWASGKRELVVRATNSGQPQATMSASAGTTTLGNMPYSTSGYYQLKIKLAARPACVTVTASCGGSATSCF